LKTKILHIKLLFYSFFFLGLVSVKAQQQPGGVRFKGGIYRTQRNFGVMQIQRDSLRNVVYKKRYYVLVQFDQLPDSIKKTELAGLGIRLFDYLPDRAYLAEVRDSIPTAELGRYAISSISQMPSGYKIARRLQDHLEEDLRDPDKVIAVSWFGSQPMDDIRQEIAAAGAVVVPEKIQPPHVIFVRASNAATLNRLAALPFVSYLASQPMKPRPLNYNNRAAQGADALGSGSGRNLQGDGIVVGVGDNSSPYTHVDFTGRLIDRMSAPVSGHGTHTSGSVAGGGIYGPLYTGMAPHSTIVSQFYSDVLANAPVYLNDYNMQLTNNSYTNYDYGCQFDGEYDALSYYTDAQMYSYPALLHVFASGNDGGYTCSPYPPQYATIKSGFQTAKNAISVGNIDQAYVDPHPLNGGSSCGPVSDGRIKPELVAGGTEVYSTLPNNNYGADYGTSMACPAVTGTLALVVQRFRQIYGGDPYAMLIKALACNTADDMGNPGPDYLYGFGSLNGRAAVECMEASQFAMSTSGIPNGAHASLPIPVPAGLQQVRIMLYWPDYPAAPFSASALVNNLDLTVTDASGTLHHPLILDPSSGGVQNAAVEGVDNLNNIEQVVVNVPAGGTFNINIAGTSVPYGPQPFVVTWQFIQPSVKVESPYGGETLLTGENHIIRWNAYGGDPNTFKVEFSPDNGATWSLIQDNIPSTQHDLVWTTPSAATTQARIRVTRNGTAYSGVSTYSFVILDAPAHVFATNTCKGYVQITWSGVTGADNYDIMQLKGGTMQKIDASTTGTYNIAGLNPDSTYWFAVRPTMAGVPGRRSYGVNVQPSGGACALSIMNNDYTVDSIIGLGSGRMYTSSQLGASVPIQIHLQNLGSVATSGPISLSYSINGGTPVTETPGISLAANSGTNYTFTNTANLSATGAYTIQIWVHYGSDPNPANDTITTVVKQLANNPITLNTSFTEDFESADTATYVLATAGFAGLDRCDFSPSNTNGRARTVVNTGFANSGSKCVTLDQAHYASQTTVDSLITTFNLSSYSIADQLWLDFFYNNHGNDSARTSNKVWIRGSDQSPWIAVYTLDTSQANIGVYQKASHIDLTAALKGASQPVTSSFQIKFGEEGYTSANNVVVDPGSPDEGYSFDDIKLSRSTTDVGIAALISPDPASTCSLSAAQAISFKVRNYGSAAATNIPVTFSINGTNVTETIPSINGKDSVTYTFTQRVNMSAYGYYTIRGTVSLPGDSYSGNDALDPVTIHTSPTISTFPYLEGFESSDGNWYTAGVNSSWQWGTPAKTVINKAANGTKCWVTSLNGNYNDNEQSYLYSPCFDLTGLSQPVFSFSHIFQTEDACDCDYHWVEYSTDGITWTKLGSVGSGQAWYDNSTRQAWQLSNTKWHVSSYDVPVKAPGVKFRIVMKSDMATDYEGVAIDDIHVFDKAAVYSGPDITSGLSQTVSGNGWVNFDVGGHRVASINPNGQNLGLTNVKVYINTGAVRNDKVQYYLDRDIVIQPATPPAAPVSVRFYFLQTEADTLMKATGCPACTTIADPYQSGVTQYSSPITSEEDGILSNDASGTFTYHLPHQDVSVIPYDNGYYAEYQVSGFSEFWINNGGPTGTMPLPLTLLSFTAVRTGVNGLLQWTTTNDKGMSRYIIEKSGDGSNYTAMDSVSALSDSASTHSYRYTDTHLQSGTNYYRLLMKDIDGRFTWSPVRTLDASGLATISIYPNPVENGILYVSSTVNIRQLRLTDVSGKVLLKMNVQGYQQTLPVGMISRGIYLLAVDTDTGTTVQKVFIK